MPLPTLTSGLIPFPTVVLARIPAALRNEVVDRNEPAVRDVPATLSNIRELIVSLPFLLLSPLPSLKKLRVLITSFGSKLELFGLLMWTPRKYR